MNRGIATALVCTGLVCCGWIEWLPGNEAATSRPAANPNEKASRKIQSSDKAVVKDIVYGLEEEENHLYLTSQPINGADRSVKRDLLKFTIPPESRVEELSLEKLDGKNLVAVIKIARGGEDDFHCLTFIAPSGGHVRDKYGFHQAKFYSTHDKLKILAVGGKHFFGSVFIVLGDIVDGSKKDFVTITKGVFYFSLCPWPPSDGTLSIFQVESEPFKLPAN